MASFSCKRAITLTTFSTNAFALGILILQLQVVAGEGPFVNSHPDMQAHSIVGCKAAGCHGSNVADSKNWQRAFRIWFDQDPHSRAYTSLLSQVSIVIVSKLANEDLKTTSPKYLAILNSKCISCHSNEQAPEAERVLGADCQICHGDADAWGSEHYSSKWKSLGGRRFENKEMLNVESVVSRAQICCSCHIGELNRMIGTNTGLDREVDHQMMAAGHPPMHFDFESYLRRYPVHWDSKDEAIGLGSHTSMWRWRVGKLTATMTKLNLLAARAERSTAKIALIGNWPELSEYSCTSCHHSLEQSSWRQDRTANTIADWDEWSVSQLDCAIRDQSREQLLSQLTTLKAQVEQKVPDARKVAISASLLRRWLATELDRVSGPSELSLEIMLPKLKSRVENINQIRNWESATQWYIATRVLAEGLGIESSREPIPFFTEDPFLGTDKLWKPSFQKEFQTPRIFHPKMLDNYSNDLKQQLRLRP